MDRQVQSEPVARFEQVGLRYGRGPEILRDVTLELPAGSFHFLLGPCGAGKTSLLRVLYLALRPTRGRLWLFGRDLAAAPRGGVAELRRRIGIVFQDFRLLPQLDVYDNIALPLRLAGGDEEAIRADVTPLLTRTGLRALAHAFPPALSGGQQQLVAIARALIVRPRLLIADEPTASVDEPLALRLIQLFQELNRVGATVLIATHNERLADRFDHARLRLEAGRVLHERASPAGGPHRAPPPAPRQAEAVREGA